MHECVMIGGGIVGLATAMDVCKKYPKASVLVLEKEQDLAQHQTGRNSGVIHSGIYYKPGSLKARFAVEGNHSMIEFCPEHRIKHEVCGKCRCHQSVGISPLKRASPSYLGLA